jgi:hypothetical protein
MFNKPCKFCSLILSGLIFFIISCDYNEESDSFESGRISVNGFLSPSDTFRINVSYLKSMWGYSVDSFLINGKLSLTLPDQSIIYLEYDSMKNYEESQTHKRKGFYKAAEFIPYIPGTYTLSVETPDKKLIVAHDSIPVAVQIQESKFFFDTIVNSYELQLAFSDEKEESRYYAISVNNFLYHDDYISSSSNLRISSPNTFIEASILAPLNQLVFSNNTFEAGDQIVDIILDYYPKGNLTNWDSAQFNIQLHTISKAYYDYAISFYKQNQAAKDFYAEPVSVFSNIEGGYGIFAGYNSSESKLVYSKFNN